MTTKEVLKLAVALLRVPQAKLGEFERLAMADRSQDAMKALGLAMSASALADGFATELMSAPESS